jgi:16S rRNA (uracil1498-N3)-methyltransferase
VNRAEAGDTWSPSTARGPNGSASSRTRTSAPRASRCASRRRRAAALADHLGAGAPAGRGDGLHRAKGDRDRGVGDRSLESERTQMHLDGSARTRRSANGRRPRSRPQSSAAIPGCPRSGPVTPASAFMESAKGYDLKLIASLQPGAKSLKSAWPSSAPRRTGPRSTCSGSSGRRGTSRRRR